MDTPKTKHEWTDDEKQAFLVGLLVEMAKRNDVASVLTHAPLGPVFDDLTKLIRGDFLDEDLVEFMKKHDIVLWMAVEMDDKMPMLFIQRRYMEYMFNGRSMCHTCYKIGHWKQCGCKHAFFCDECPPEHAICEFLHKDTRAKKTECKKKAKAKKQAEAAAEAEAASGVDPECVD